MSFADAISALAVTGIIMIIAFVVACFFIRYLES